MSTSEPTAVPDQRLYLAFPEGWSAAVKEGWEKEMCHTQAPGENYFHRLVAGEIYLRKGDEKYCLNCAMRLGVVTTDRVSWQRESSAQEPRIMPPGE